MFDKNEIIEMARQAGWPDWEIVGMKGELKTFAKLVDAKATAKEREWWKEHIKKDIDSAKKEEREACAKVCDERDDDYGTFTAGECALAIRARGEA